MTDHSLYAVKYTARVPYGEWVAHDESRIDGYGEPKEFETLYVASSAEIALAHFNYWLQFTDGKRETKVTGCDNRGRVKLLLEL